ncbi:hypothetical protein MBLNU459_g0564t1 [Dothideomycetes sp. NU459]
MHSGDATIDIPLHQVSSQGQSPTGARRQDSTTPFATATGGTPLTKTTTAERRRTMGGRRIKKTSSRGESKIGYDGEEDTLNRLGRFYTKILNFSIITRYFVYVTPLALCIAIPIIVGATVAEKAAIGGVRIVWFFTWIEIVWLSLWGSKIVSHFLPVVFQLVAGVVSSGTRKYALIIKALEIPLSLVGWAITSLATFAPIMTRNPTQRKNNDTGLKDWETIMNQILAAALAGSLVLLVEKFFIQLISINYHRKQFNARIKESKHNVFLLGLLYDASRALFPAYCNEFAEEDYIIGDQLNLAMLGGSKRRSHHRSGSVTPFRLLQDVGRFGDKVTSAFGNVAQEITGKQVFNPNSAHSIVTEALEKKRTSEALARRLWMSFVIEGKEALYEEDIVEVLGESRKAEAEEAFLMLDKDYNGDISLDEAIQAIVEVSRDRKALGSSMHDVDQAINVLDRLLMVVVFVIVVFTFIAFLNKSFVTTLATAGTALLSLSFVFSVTAQEVLGSCIFLFVKHPYDIGDRVDIGSEKLTVDHISLLFTVFKRVAGVDVGQLVQIPNSVLNTVWIENVSRSKLMKEQLTLDVSFDTSFEDIQSLKTELLTFVTDKDNSRDFLPDIDVEVLGTSDMSKLQLRVDIRHKGNYSNESQRAARRSKFMCALVQSLRRVPIYGPGGGGDAQGSSANPSYSVAVSDDFAAKQRTDAAKAKDAKRLIPTMKEETGSSLSPVTSRSNKNISMAGLGMTNAQAAIVEDLNSRDPADDPSRDDIWTSSREDGSTLGGERSPIERQEIEEMKGMLRRESTRGKRKPGNVTMQQPGVPTINEPQPPIAYSQYAQQAEATMQIDDYEQYRTQAGGLSTPSAGPPLPTSPAAYVQGTSYMQPYRTTSQGQGQNLEMRQMSRSPSNPYANRQQQQQPQPDLSRQVSGPFDDA